MTSISQMAVYLSCEQVNFSCEDPKLDSCSIDSLASVVDANVDFVSPVVMDEDEEVKNNLVKEWMSSNTNVLTNGKTEGAQSLEIAVCESEQETTLESTETLLHDAKCNLKAGNYPEIPLPVAQYINKTNPEWCTEAQKYFHMTQTSKFSSEINFSSDPPPPISPFRSMTATTEALALQHSVIGNNGVQPVSPDIVAQVVARTKLRLHQQAQAAKYSPHKQNFTTTSPEHYINSKVPNIASSSTDFNGHDSRRSSVTSISSSIFSKKNARESDMPTVHRPTRVSSSHYSSTVDCVADSETESCFSEKLELESVCSDTFETESNVSEMSGLGDELFQVKKLLDQVDKGKKIANDQKIEDYVPAVDDQSASKQQKFTQTDSFEVFNIMRAKANLEGQLESLTTNEGNLNKECTKLNSLIAVLQTQVSVLSNQLDKATEEKQTALQKVEFLDSQQEKWDNIIKEYQNAIENKISEIKALKEDLSDSEQANIHAKINIEEMKVDMESKDGAISGLKKKIAELHCEVQVLQQLKVQLHNDVKNVKHDMESLEKSRDWYKDQLHITQESRDQLHKDLILLQSNHVSLSNKYEKSKIDIDHLKQQLSDSHQRAVGEKEVLMKHLEDIEADMKDRESLFENIQKDKGSIEDALFERAKRIEEEHSKITHLTFTVSDLEYQLSIVKSDICEKDKNISALEKEKAEMYKQVALLQKTVNDKDLSVQQLTQSLKDANCKIAHNEMNLKSLENQMETLKIERNAVDMAFAAANEEKRTTNDSLKVVQDNLSQFQSNFKQMKVEIVSKTSQINQLHREKSVLEESLQKLEDKVTHEQKSFEQEMFKENQNCTVMVDDLKKQKQDIENILEVYSRDLQDYQQRVQIMEQERKDLRNEITKLQSSGAEMEVKITVLQNENIKLKEEVFGLSESVSILKSHNNTTLDSNHFDSFKKEYTRKIRAYKSNIQVLTRKLKEKLSECDSLSSEIKSLKELNAKVNERTDQDELGEAQNLILQLEDELKSLREIVRGQEISLQKNQEIIIELEKEKGKITATSDNNTSLKQSLFELKTSIAEKEAVVAELNSQLQINNAEANERCSSYQTKLATLEEELKKEKQLVKSLRQQVFQEKRADSYHQRQLASLIVGLEQANQTADARKKEVLALQAQMELNHQAELKNRETIELLQSQILSHQTERQKLKKELVEASDKDPALAQQLKSLSWHLKEKNNEITAWKEKHMLLEDRYQVEAERLSKSVQKLQENLEKNKTELDMVRKQKFHYQSQLGLLRKAFKANLGTFTVSRNDDTLPFDSNSTFDESFVNGLLQQSSELHASRPLNHLQECLNSLKQEMAELQKQLCDNVDISS